MVDVVVEVVEVGFVPSLVNFNETELCGVLDEKGSWVAGVARDELIAETRGGEGWTQRGVLLDFLKAGSIYIF